MKKFAFLGCGAVLGAIAIAATNSGLNKGEMVSAFHPYTHVMGPLANSSGCFPCTFKARPQVQAWVNGESAENLKTFAKTLDGAMTKYAGKEFKAMIVVITKPGDEKAKSAEVLATLKPLNLKNVDVSVLSTTHEAISSYKINTASTIKNTIFAYKDWQVQNKWVNVTPDAKGLAALSGGIDSLVK